MASVSLYVAIRSKVGQGHEVNHTNVFLDGKCQETARMTAGYENQFSCRQGCFGICEGVEEGVRGSETARNLLLALGEAGAAEKDKLRRIMTELPDDGKINIGLLSVKDGELSLSGLGELPLYQLRSHRLRRLGAAGEAENGRVLLDAVRLENKDRLLLCTKELAQSIEPAMLQTILDERGEPDQIAGDLVREALNNGAKRDVTAIVVVCDAVEELMAEPFLEDDSAEEAAQSDTMAVPIPWYQNKKVLGLAGIVGACVLAVAGVTLASVLGKRDTAPAAGSGPAPLVTVSETQGLLTQPQTTQEETLASAPESEPESTRERTTRRRTTTTAKHNPPSTTAPKTNATEKPQETSTDAPHSMPTLPSQPLEE